MARGRIHGGTVVNLNEKVRSPNSNTGHLRCSAAVSLTKVETSYCHPNSVYGTHNILQPLNWKLSTSYRHTSVDYNTSPSVA